MQRSAPVTYVGRLLAMAIGLALTTSCYQPSIETCRYACSGGEGGTCPAGYACNSGRCALEGTSCAGVADAATEADGTTLIQVRVLGPDSAGLPDATVLFADASNQLVARETTNATGLATARMAAGGSATVITPQDGVVHLTTYVDLWPNATIVSQPMPATSSVAVTVTYADFNNAEFAATTSCHGAGSSVELETTVMMPARCLSGFDLFAVTANVQPPHFLAAANQTTQAVALAGAWKSMTGVSGTFLGIPLDGLPALPVVRLNAFFDVDQPFTAELTTATASANGAWSSHIPDDGAGPMRSTLELTMIGPFFDGRAATQTFVESLPDVALEFEHDLANRVLPWSHGLVVNLPTRAVVWSVRDLAEAMPGPVSAISATLVYRMDSMDVHWRLVAPGAHLDAPTEATRRLAWPALPDATLGLEPSSTAQLKTASVDLLLVNPEATEEVRSTLEPALQENALLGQSRVTWYTRQRLVL